MAAGSEARLSATRRQTVRPLLSSASVEWETPPALFARLEREFGPFDLDPAATAENAKAPRYFTSRENGLAQEWTGRVFLNPPYGRGLARWLEKACRSVEQGSAELVVCLLPVRTDSRWWLEWVLRADLVRFLCRRLSFGAGNRAPFPAAVVVYRRRPRLPVFEFDDRE